jgi:hypothetical protein
MKKRCEIYQPFGIGDILILEPIARNYYKAGYEIFWQVIEKYSWIKDYIKYINYIPKTVDNMDSSFYEDNIILSLRDTPGHWIYGKYEFCKVDPNIWRTYSWERNLEKEKKLYEELNIKKPYILVNRNYYTHNVYSNVKMFNNNENIIEMSFYKDYTLLDWGFILENAEEIHTVDTSLVWLIESSVLNINCKLNMYPRIEHTKFINVKDVLQKKWNLYEGDYCDKNV